MWINKYRLERIESDLRRLESHVQTLGYETSVSDNLGLANDPWDRRYRVPLVDVVFAILRKLNMKLDVKASVSPEVKLTEKSND